MKATAALFLGLVASTTANIIFNHVPIACNPKSTKPFHGCLKGQLCLKSDSKYLCLAPPTSRAVKIAAATPPFSTDGTCGSQNGGTICNPNSLVYTGGCCSQYGWCGNTPAHCLASNGCQSGCTSTTTSTTPAASSTAPRSDGLCGKAYGGATCDPKGPYGGCCSQYGFCGSTPAHCLVANGCQNGCTTTTTSTTPAASSTAPRSDGLCGKAYGGATCDPKGPYGGCCSQYGFCGSTPAHCLVANGCQNGCTSTTTSTTPAASASSTAPRSDGLCGKAYGGATCDPKGPYGGCCSQYGFCGSTPAHCLATNGCQNGCTPVSSSSSSTKPAATTEPVIAPVTSTSPAQSGPTTTDGTCGSSNGNTVCGNWPQGSCCSMYGFCGSTSAHCGAGCQSGPCLSAPAQAAPGAKAAPAAPNPGTFSIVGKSGVPAMHAALMPNGRVVFLDKIENYTQLTLPNGQYAYSSEYNPADNTVVPLAYKTNAFCSGGAFLPDGRVISVGGNAPLTFIDPTVGDGFNAIRYLQRSSTDATLNGQAWSEPGNKLASDRWYATVQTLPDGTMFVASGSLNGLDPTVLANNNPTYEILSPTAITGGVNSNLGILIKNQPYYMYPFIHLLKDGTLFIFASKSSERFSVASNTSLTTYPDLPGDYRTYPNTGGSVLLPASSGNNWNPDIIICGGGAYQDITSPTDPSCGRISPLATTPTWEMDSMPEGRGMVEGTLLPDGTVLWLNGGELGAQGFGLCTDPALEGLLYNPTAALGARWSTLASSTIPRLYHSVALLLLDGTVMIAGSNPVQMPVLVASTANPYITEFRVENYVPPYLQGANASKRPTNVVLSSKTLTPNGSTFKITFTAPTGAQKVSVVLYHGGFVTHSLHMGARMLQLDNTGWTAGAGSKTVTVTLPPNNNVAPPGPYVVYVLCDGIPAIGQFVSVT